MPSPIRSAVASALEVRALRLRMTFLGLPVEPEVATTTAVPARTSTGNSPTMPSPSAGPAPLSAPRRPRRMSRGSSPTTGSSLMSRHPGAAR